MGDRFAEAALRSWQLPTGFALALLVVATVYMRGWLALRRQMPQRFGTGRLVAFLAGLAAIFIAVASPLDAFAGLLLQLHMAQHLLLMMIAPPLIWLGFPAVPLLRGLPDRAAKSALGPFLASPGVRRIARIIGHPVACGTAFAATMFIWHLPGPYQLAILSPAWHQVEHLNFLAGGLLFWWPVIQPWPSQPVWPRWAMIPYLLLGDVLNTLLAGFLSFCERVVYPAYAAVPRLTGGSPLDDQVMAGALMWLVGSAACLIPIVLIVNGLLAPPVPRVAAALDRAALEPARRRRPFDLLAAPLVGHLLRWRYGRRLLQFLLFGLALGVIIDGYAGPRMAPMNLAGVLPWTYWRGLTVVALLAGGNFFCMACPFMLPREIAKRALPASWHWPRRLRAKWLAAGLLAVYLWAYEAFALWDSPWWTASLALAYFVVAFAVDGLFRGASFCKYVCPIGQFNFLQSLASPLTVRPRSLAVCATCTTYDCIRGNARSRGCELDLFLPEKRGNLDCTFCLDCVAACPHDNVGIFATVPARDLARDPHRASLRRLSERPDLAALAVVTVFAAFANAAGMVGPVLAWERTTAARLGCGSTLPIVTAFSATAMLVAPALAVALATLAGHWLGATRSSHRALACRFAFALVPLGLGMWSAHFLFHFLSGAATLAPVVQRVAADLGGAVFGSPAWATHMPSGGMEWLTELELLLLDLGLLASLYVCWRVALSESARGSRALGLFAPWGLLAAALWGAGVWIVFQPMEMRGMVH